MRLELANLSYEVRGKSLFGRVSVRSIAPAHIVICGPSGSGKSTLCRVLARRLPANIARDIAANPYFIGVLSHDTAEIPRASYIGAIPEMQLIGSRVADLFLPMNADTAARHLETVELDRRFLQRDPQTLSTGEATRVLLALASTSENRMAILDSPWGLIDASSRERIRENFISKLANGILIETDSIFTSHGGTIPTEKLLVRNKSDQSVILGEIASAMASSEEDPTASRPKEFVQFIGEIEIATSRDCLRLVADDFIFPSIGISWIRGDNGTGKSSFGRFVSGLPMRGKVSQRGFKLLSGEKNLLPAESIVGYAAGRFPLGDPSLVGAIIRLIDEAAIFSAFSSGCGNSIDPRHPAQWATCPLLTALGSTLYQLSLKKRIVFVDEPFAGATREEAEQAVSILRRWSYRFHAAVFIISHLTQAPIAEEEQAIGFLRQTAPPNAITSMKGLKALKRDS